MQTTQLRVTMPMELQIFLKTKAEKFGLNMSAYVKNLIINDVKDIAYPVRQASPNVEKDYSRAKSAEKKKLLVNADNLDDFLTKL